MLLFDAKIIVQESHNNSELAYLKKKKEKYFWPSGDFLVWYFCDYFSHHWAFCSS